VGFRRLRGQRLTGDVSIVGGKLLVGQGVDMAYFYASIDTGPFGRVPATPGLFIEPQIGGLDVTPYFGLPAGAEDLQIDAWGWQGSKLVKLGSGHWELDRIGSAEYGIGTTLDGLYKKAIIARIDDGPADDMRLAAVVERASDREWAAEAAVGGGAGVPPVAGVPTPSFGTGSETVTLYRSGTVERPWDENDKAPIKRDFGWTSYGAGIDHVVWQVLPYPTSTTPDLGPPFLIDQGVAGVKAGQPFGEFTIDFRPYFGGARHRQLLGVRPDVIDDRAADRGSLLPRWCGRHTEPDEPVQDRAEAAGAEAAGAGPLHRPDHPDEGPHARRPGVQLRPLDVVDKPPPIELNVPVLPDYTKRLHQPRSTRSPHSSPTRACPAASSCRYADRRHGDDVLQELHAEQDGICTTRRTTTAEPADVFESFVEFVGDVWDAVFRRMSWIKAGRQRSCR
jgi:hypothetical protein